MNSNDTNVRIRTITTEIEVPSIHVDRLQVKSINKAAAKADYKADLAPTAGNVVLGILRTWTKRSQLKLGFEIFENVANTDETRAIMRELIDEAMAKLSKDGVDGLLAEIAQRDPEVSRAIELAVAAKANGIDVNVWGWDKIRKAAVAALGRKLWHIATGAGVAGSSWVAVIDNTLEPGTIVVSNNKVGTECAVWRFPCVLPEALVTCKVVAPRRQHLVSNGDRLHIPANTIFMHEDDIVGRLCGDDDGDVVGLSADPRIVTLFKNKVDTRKFAIEPDGQKVQLDLLTEEGLTYINKEDSALIGLGTVWRSQFLAMGDLEAARCATLMIQEGIDSMKRIVRWTNPNKAVALRNWRLVDGVYHIHWFKFEGKYLPLDEYNADKHGNVEFSQNFWDQENECDFDAVEAASWVRRRFMSFGMKFRQNPTAWRIQHTDAVGSDEPVMTKNRIDANYWVSCASKDNGFAATFEGQTGNLMHYMHDYALGLWQDVEQTFAGLNDAAELSVTECDVLPKLMEKLGFSGAVNDMSWGEYLHGLRTISGVSAYSSAMSRLYSTRGDLVDETAREAFFAKQQQLRNQLNWSLTQLVNEYGLQALVDIWYHEHKFVGKGGSVSMAYSAIAWDGSPLLDALDIDGSEGCDFLSDKKVTAVVRKAMSSDNAFETLSNLIWTNEKAKPANAPTHFRMVKDDCGNGIAISECDHCKRVLQDALVREIRRTKSRGEKVAMSDLTRNLNTAVVPDLTYAENASL